MKRALLVALGVATLILTGSVAGGAPAFADDLPFTKVAKVEIMVPATVVEGSQLIAADNGWSPEPDDIDYQWLDDGAVIGGATDDEYFPTSADVGHQISVQATAHKSGYLDATATSASVRVVPFTNVAGGAITGTPRAGHPLAFTHGDLTPSDVTLSYKWVREFDKTRILSTASTYTPVDLDAEAELILTVTASASGYVTTTSTFTSAIIQPSKMTPAVLPPSFPVVGIQVEADDISWNPHPTTTSFQWNASNHPIPGATSRTYTPTSSDVGKSLSITETGSVDGYGTATVTSSLSARVKKNFSSIPTPTITGTPMVGGVLTAHTAKWTPAANAGYTYTWYVGGAPEGTGSTFTPFDDSDAGQTVTVVIQGTATTAGPALSPHSLPTAPIAKGQVPAGTVSLPATPLTNESVCASLKGWAQTTYYMTYDWYLDGNLVDSIYDACYTPPLGSEGKTLTVTAGQDFPDSPPVVASSKTYIVGHGAYEEYSFGPQIVGTVAVGSTLSIDESYWRPMPTHFSVFWYVDGTYGETKVASGPQFTIPSKDRGKYIRAKIYGSGPLLKQGTGYTTFAKVESGTFAATPVPTISGTLTVGKTLTAHRGTWSPSSGAVFHYQWYRQVGASSTPIAISHATKSTYKIGSAERGDLLLVRVTGSKSGYTTAAESSAVTAEIP
jgi:hypothetical protein